MSEFNFEPFILSFELAGLTTFILFFIALPLAWWLSQTKSRFKPFVEALSALPIVLPPSVIGFYILIALSTQSGFGRFLEESFGITLVFNFTGLVVASCFYSFPFMVQPLQSGFESLNKNMIEASYIARKTQIQTLFYIAIPNTKPAVLTALIVTFAHTVGEFGVVLMVGGSIPGETKVASVAIYEFVEILDYSSAHVYSGIMVLLSFLTLLGVYTFNRRHTTRLGTV
jgi:molybdate transport system permease protein